MTTTTTVRSFHLSSFLSLPLVLATSFTERVRGTERGEKEGKEMKTREGKATINKEEEEVEGVKRNRNRNRKNKQSMQRKEEKRSEICLEHLKK
jgi:hypothetical protein